ATGPELWRYQHDGEQHDADYASHVGVDAAGDVLAAGLVSDLPLPEVDPPSAVKLRGGDGSEVWRTHLATVDVRDLAIDANGDLLVAATVPDPVSSQAFGVTKLSGATGAALWTARISEPIDTWQSALQIGALPNGDAAAVGFIGSLDDAASLLVAVFDGSTGAERWRWTAQGTQHFGRGVALTVSAGELLVAGQVRNDGSCYDMLVARLDGGSGSLLGS